MQMSTQPGHPYRKGRNNHVPYRNQSNWAHRLIQSRLRNQIDRAQLTQSDLRGSGYTTSASSPNESGIRIRLPGPKRVERPRLSQRHLLRILPLSNPMAYIRLPLSLSGLFRSDPASPASNFTVLRGKGLVRVRFHVQTFREPPATDNVRWSLGAKQKSKLRLITNWTAYV